LHVLDLTRLLPGGYCSLLLADMGADVIKVEEPGRGDYNREIEPLARSMSGSFLLLSCNERSIELNLKSAVGREILLRLVRVADVVIEGFRPSVMEVLRAAGYAAAEISGFHAAGAIGMADEQASETLVDRKIP
jgi:crotonobetainyl-CoA:carnitine CoA-transferase CaiB-like acyl-CoA transferase